MNSLCFVLVLLFTTRIIYTREESPVDQNKTVSASSTTGGNPPPHGIDFDEVELFKDYDELPRDPPNLMRRSNQPVPPINSTKTHSPKNGTTAIIKGNQTSGKVYEDYDINSLQLDKYKFMLASKKFKTINATNVKFLRPKPGTVVSQTQIKQIDIKNSSLSLVPPNGTLIPKNTTANHLNNTALVPGSVANINFNKSVTPIPWVISPACLEKNESKYLFSAIFSKKPTVHLMTGNNGTTASNQTANIVINNNTVTLSVGNTTPTNVSYVNINSSTPPKRSEVLNKTSNTVVVTTDNKTIPVTNVTQGKLKIDDALLKELKSYALTIQNNTKPQNTNSGTLSKVGNTITITKEIKTHMIENKPKSVLLVQTNPTAQNTQLQQALQLIPNLQTNVSVQTPTVTITSQVPKKTESIPLLFLDNSLLQTPLPGMTLKKISTTALSKLPQAVNTILNSEVGERSFFPTDHNQKPAQNETVGDLITQQGNPDILYELFKNITLTNFVNEDLTRKLLDESQIHTQQNWQLIKGNTDILNVLKNKSEQYSPSQTIT